MSPPAEADVYKKDFWRGEQPKFATPHYRLRKIARLVNRIVGDRAATMLDLGCGPGTLGLLLNPGICYYGLDLVVPEQARSLREADLTESAIQFDDLQFDVIVAQGVFEYLGGHQSEKFAEISRILAPGGRFVVTYVNFDHRKPYMYPPYSNVQAHDAFRGALQEHFVIERSFPTSYNWNGGQPNRKWLQAANMRCNANVPVVGGRLAVEHIFVCAGRR